MKSFVVTLCSVNPMYSVKLMSVKVMLHCTYLQQVEHNFEQMGVLPRPGLSQHDSMREVEGVVEMIPSAQVGFFVGLSYLTKTVLTLIVIAKANTKTKKIIIPAWFVHSLDNIQPMTKNAVTKHTSMMLKQA